MQINIADLHDVSQLGALHCEFVGVVQHVTLEVVVCQELKRPSLNIESKDKSGLRYVSHYKENSTIKYLPPMNMLIRIFCPFYI